MQLDEIRILDLTRLLPGPYGTQLLADMGAEVVKIEPPGEGDYARAMEPIVDGIGGVFGSTNRGKQSITLNLKDERAQEILLTMAEEADVLFEQFRPGVVDRLGIDYETVRERNTDIVYCSLTGYGQTGPYSDRVGHDLNYVGYGGLLDMTRPDEDSSPVLPGYPIADMNGGLFGVFAILGALLSRELGHGGEYIDVSMTDIVLSLSQSVAPMAFADADPRPGETVLTGKYPSYGVYETADDRYVALAALEPHFWENFCAAVDREDLVDAHHSSDPVEVAALEAELEALFRERTRDEWAADLAEAETMVSPVKTLAEAIEDPQIRSRDIIEEGSPPRIGFPANGTDIGETDESVPELGEHTAAVLRRHGIENLDELRADGVI
jgi:crotonobetainyl-CoA:carnitine CoA-transferase CaiB-like acyl-CoA transferase